MRDGVHCWPYFKAYGEGDTWSIAVQEMEKAMEKMSGTENTDKGF